MKQIKKLVLNGVEYEIAGGGGALPSGLVEKLDGIEAGAQVNRIEQIQVDGVDVPQSGKTVNLNIANNYVRKEAGKGLSTNDFTDADKAKLIALDNNLWYGIEWDDNVSASSCRRIGNMDMHRSLPIQSGMRGCLLSDDGEVREYLPDYSWEGCTLDGSAGQVMVEIPEHYVRFESDGSGKHRRMESTVPLPGFYKVPKMYCGAFPATVQRSANKLCSVVNTTADFRGGSNQADWDGLSKSMLGMPAAQISRTGFRNYARNRKPGSTEWNCFVYDLYKELYWLYVVEYADRNCQLPYNPRLTVEGFRQGGLGDCVSTLDWDKWKNFNSNYPVVPCGATIGLGNRTGVVEYTLPTEYDATPLVVGVPRYRGIQLLDGVWWWCDGINIRISADTENGGNGLSKVMVCHDPAFFSDSGYDHYEYVGDECRIFGNVKTIVGGSRGEIITSTVGGGSSMYFCDGHGTSILDNSESLRASIFGGNASGGSDMGFICMHSAFPPTYADSRITSYLCFIPA